MQSTLHSVCVSFSTVSSVDDIVIVSLRLPGGFAGTGQFLSNKWVLVMV